MALRLSRYPRFETRDADEAREAYVRSWRRFRLEVEGARYAIQAHHAQLPVVAIDTLTTGGPLRVWTEADDRFYIVCLWPRGANEFHAHGRRFLLDSGEGFLLTPDVEGHHWSSGDQEIVAVRIPRVLLLTQARQLAGRLDAPPLMPTGPILFDSPFWQKTDALISELDCAASRGTRHENFFAMFPEISLEAQFDVIQHLISSTPNNYRALLEREEKGEPWIQRLICRKLEEYMDGHLREPFHKISGMLAELAGRNIRSVERAFSSIYRKPPSQAFREKKLDKVRFDLLTRPEASVQLVAFYYGFRNLSRFRRYYAAYHRETPEETLQKGAGVFYPLFLARPKNDMPPPENDIENKKD